ncbi:hypothetical protein BH10CHL1_BH10CHL1_41570 [soil metagenome]
MNSPLIVTGMHRSGTSLIALLLTQLGIQMGDALIPADFRNPRGYYEDVDFVRLHQAMLQTCVSKRDGGWPDWGWTESESFKRTALDKFRNRAQILLTQRAIYAPVWGWKDPRTTLFLDFWDRQVADTLGLQARYLLIYRFPWEVADSVQRLAAPVLVKYPSYAYHMWAFYNRHLLDFYQQHRERCVLISMNGLLTQLGALVTLLQHKLALPAPSIPLEPWVDQTLFVTSLAQTPLAAFIGTLYPAVIEQLQALDQAADLSGAALWDTTTPCALESMSPVDAELYLTQLLHVQHEQAALRQQLQAMEQSIFWRARQRLVQIKQALYAYSLTRPYPGYKVTQQK